MNYNNEGFKKIFKKLEEVKEKNQIEADLLFDDEFMQKYTSVNNLQELYDKSGFPCETEDDIINISKAEEWDEYITKVTQFDSWISMIQIATGEYIKKQFASLN